MQGSPTSVPWTGTSLWPVRNQAAQQEVNAMRLNHPETVSPTLVPGKIVFHEIGPWCQKGWGLLV